MSDVFAPFQTQSNGPEQQPEPAKRKRGRPPRQATPETVTPTPPAAEATPEPKAKGKRGRPAKAAASPVEKVSAPVKTRAAAAPAGDLLHTMARQLASLPDKQRRSIMGSLNQIFG